MTSFKYFYLAALCFITSSIFANNVPQERMMFAIFIAPKLENYNKEAWQHANAIIDKYIALRKESSHFSMALLEAGLSAAAEVRSVVNHNDLNIDSWTLININPRDFGKRMEDRPYRFIKFWLAREEFSDEQWQTIEKSTESLIQYCEKTTDDFDFSYYCNEIRKMYAMLLS